MGKEKWIVIKEAPITNNCPECYNQELVLTFYQKHTHNAFYQRTAKTVKHEITCKKCGSIIYPVNWSQDIERVFDYYNKLVRPDRPSVRFTLLFYGVLILLLIVIAGLTYLYLEDMI